MITQVLVQLCVESYASVIIRSYTRTVQHQAEHLARRHHIRTCPPSALVRNLEMEQEKNRSGKEGIKELLAGRSRTGVGPGRDSPSLSRVPAL
jgi:hypothetical protein